MSISEVCRSWERLRGVVGSEGNTAAVLGEGIHVRLDRQRDWWRQRGALNAEEPSTGRLSASASSVGTAHTTLVSPNAQ